MTTDRTPPPTGAPEPLHFGYWSDPLCIWAFVAQPKLEHLLERFGERLRADYHVVPVFGSVGWRFREGPWAEAGVEGRVAATARVAASFGHPEVTGEVWRSACPASSWGPGTALKAVSVLQDAGLVGPQAFAHYQWALREAFFVDNRNVSERTAQLEVAEQCHIPRAPMCAALDDGRALALLWEDTERKDKLGIQGSPTFVFDGGRAMLYGNVSEEIVLATAEALVGPEAPGCSAC